MDGKQVRAFANNMVDMKNFVDFDPEECGVTELVFFPALCQLLDQFSGEELKDAVRGAPGRPDPQAHHPGGHHGLHQLPQLSGPRRGHPR